MNYFTPDELFNYLVIGQAKGADGLYQRLQEELLHIRTGGVMEKPQLATNLFGVRNYRFTNLEKEEII